MRGDDERNKILEIWDRSNKELVQDSGALSLWMAKTKWEKCLEFMEATSRGKYKEGLCYVSAFFEGVMSMEWKFPESFDSFLFYFLQFYVMLLADRYAPKAGAELLQDLLNRQEENQLRGFLQRGNLTRTMIYVFYQLASEKGSLSDRLPVLHPITALLLPVMFELNISEKTEESLCDFTLDFPENDNRNFLIFCARFYSASDFQKLLRSYIAEQGFDNLMKGLLEHALHNFTEDQIMFLCELIQAKDGFGDWLYMPTSGGLPITRAQLRKLAKVSDFFAEEIRSGFSSEKNPPLTRGNTLRLLSAIGEEQLLRKTLNESSLSPRIFGMPTAVDLLLDTMADGLNPLCLCILSGNDNAILFLLDIYLKHLSYLQKIEFFLGTCIWKIREDYWHGSFLHFLARYRPSLVPVIYERVENEMRERLSTTLSRLDYLGLKVYDFPLPAEHREMLQAKIPPRSPVRKVLALDLDRTLLGHVKECNDLKENVHYVLKDLSTCVYFRKTALKALILWVMHHPDMELFIVTTSFRSALDIRQILQDITDESEGFLLNHLDGYFSGMNAASDEYTAFLDKEGLEIRASMVSQKWLQTQYLLTQRGHDLKNIKACLYDDRLDIIEQANAQASYDLTGVVADLYMGGINSLLKIAEFCEITQALSAELPRALQKFQVLFRRAIQEDFVENIDLGEEEPEWAAEEIGSQDAQNRLNVTL